MNLAPPAACAALPSACEVLFDARTLQERIASMARKIESDYGGAEVTAVGLLNGAVPFVCDLVKHLRLPVRLDFLATSRFRGLRPGEARILKDLDDDIEGRHVLVVDNIVDTGLHLHYVCRQLGERRPASLCSAVLLQRPELRIAQIPLRYAGFEVSEEFLIGYGLDYHGRYRNLPFIARCEVEEEEESPAGGGASLLPAGA